MKLSDYLIIEKLVRCIDGGVSDCYNKVYCFDCACNDCCYLFAYAINIFKNVKSIEFKEAK